jgi:hypothetical protein
MLPTHSLFLSDPLFGSYVFNIDGGRSKYAMDNARFAPNPFDRLARCPYFPGTYQREQPRLVLISENSQNVLPGASAIFKVALINAANEEGSYALHAKHRSGTNHIAPTCIKLSS